MADKEKHQMTIPTLLTFGTVYPASRNYLPKGPEGAVMSGLLVGASSAAIAAPYNVNPAYHELIGLMCDNTAAIVPRNSPGTQNAA